MGPGAGPLDGVLLAGAALLVNSWRGEPFLAVVAARDLSERGVIRTSCATQLQRLLQPLASLKKYIFQALAPLASLTGLQRGPTLFQKRQLLQALAPLAWLHWKPTLLQT